MQERKTKKKRKEERGRVTRSGVKTKLKGKESKRERSLTRNPSLKGESRFTTCERRESSLQTHLPRERRVDEVVDWKDVQGRRLHRGSVKP
jgi:hypothetical protein